MFTKSNMTVLDPFTGSGTSLLASKRNHRKSIGIDLNEEYKDLAKERFKKLNISLDENPDVKYLIGNSLHVLEGISGVDYIVTSPPYHNILKNKGKGLRDDRSDKGYRNGSRQGVEYYSNMEEDLGNQETYDDFLDSFKEIMSKSYQVLNDKKYCSIIISDF